MCALRIGLIARWNIIFWQLSVFGRICVQTRNASDTDVKSSHIIMTCQPLVILVKSRPITLYMSTIGGLACKPSSKIMSKVVHIANNSRSIAIQPALLSCLFRDPLLLVLSPTFPWISSPIYPLSRALALFSPWWTTALRRG